MPRQKDFKRLVRARMQKTGEAYTAARAQILRKSTPVLSPPPVAAATPVAVADPVRRRRMPSAPKAPGIDYAALAGVSDAVIKEKTGCPWSRWVPTLDALGAETMSHRDVARLVHEKYKVDGWWAQTVTVGYERIKGLRVKGQLRNGSYEASKSRTFNAPAETVFDAFAKPKMRGKWLAGEKVVVRTATPQRSLRLGWSDGSIVAVWLEPKGPAKTVVSVTRGKLPDKASADRIKQYWGERLQSLGELIAT